MKDTKAVDHSMMSVAKTKGGRKPPLSPFRKE